MYKYLYIYNRHTYKPIYINMSKELCVYIYIYICIYIYTEVKPPQFCCASPETAWKKPYITTSLIYIYIYVYMYWSMDGKILRYITICTICTTIYECIMHTLVTIHMYIYIYMHIAAILEYIHIDLYRYIYIYVHLYILVSLYILYSVLFSFCCYIYSSLYI